MILSALLLAQAASVYEYSCYPLLESGDEVTVGDRFSLVEAKQESDPLDLGVPDGTAISCYRSTLIPLSDDWRVLDAGHPLAITESDPETGAGRMLALELNQGQVHVRMIKGEFTAEEMPAMQAAVDKLQSKLQER